MEDSLAVIARSNLSEIQRLEQVVAASEMSQLRPAILHVQSMIIHMYQVTAALAVRETEAARAAECWRSYMMLCDRTLAALMRLKESGSAAAGGELYDLVLDYKNEAKSRYHEDIEDEQWLTKLESNPELKSLIGQL